VYCGQNVILVEERSNMSCGLSFGEAMETSGYQAMEDMMRWMSFAVVLMVGRNCLSNTSFSSDLIV